MNVFISWSGANSLSHRFAFALKEWICDLFIDRLECFVSTNDIGAGTTWLDKLFHAIDRSDAGIIVVTHESIASEWLLFEAGALANKVGWNNQRLCPLLLDLHPSALNDPLASFQYKSMPMTDENVSYEGIKAVVTMLNEMLVADSRFTEERLQRQFEAWWPKLWETYQALCSETQSAPVRAPSISPNDLYLEVRSALRQISESIAELHWVREVEQTVACPYCKTQQAVVERMKSGETRVMPCRSCGRPFNIHANQGGAVFSRAITPTMAVPSMAAPPASLVEINPLCFYCHKAFRVQIANRPGSTTNAICEHCGRPVNVHTDSLMRAFCRPNTVAEHPLNANRSSREEFLRQTDCWIELSLRPQLADLATKMTAPNPARAQLTPKTLAAAMANESLSSSSAFISKTMINQFVKLLVIGGAFEFADPLTNRPFSSEFHNSLDEERIVAALFRGYVRRLRMSFELNAADFQALAKELEAEALPGGAEALLVALGEEEPASPSPGKYDESVDNLPLDGNV